jgi:hypothetical protein
MGYNWFGLICGALAVLLFALVYRAGRHAARPRLIVWIAVALLFASPGLVLAAHYARVVPEWPWFYEARSWPGSELWVVPLGVLGGCVAAWLPRRALLLPLLATTGAATGPFLKPVLAPLPEKEFREVWTKNVCIQSTLATCGPASLATILRARGIEARERDIARAAHSYRGGTEAWYLAREARARGLRATFRREAGFPGQVRWPAIVGVKVEDGLGHFIPFLGREEGRFLVGDPMIGPERLTREELERRYRFTGFALELSRPADGASR